LPAEANCPDRSGEVEALQAELRFVRSQVAALGGSFSAWPETAPHEYKPKQVQAWLADNFDPEMGDLEMVDCDEFPCIAVVRLPEATMASSAVVQPLADLFSADHGQHKGRVHMVGRQEAAWGFVVMGPNLAEYHDASTRLPQRLEELAEFVSDEPR